jgi:glycosyltransferase involved in cell wall biosynthesis
MQRKLTIVQVLPNLISGGVEKGVLEVAKHITLKGHESIVISGGGRMVGELERDGSKHIRWNIGKKSLTSFFYIIKLIRLIKNKKIDIIHARSRLPAWIVFLALKFINRNKRPHFVTTVHGFNSISFYSSIMTKGERVFVVSKSVQKFITKNYKFSKLNIVLNYRGVDPKEFNLDSLLNKEWLKSWKKEFPYLNNKIILSFPSRITRRKGHEDFIYLISKLKQDNMNIHGLIIGDPKLSSKKYLQSLKNQVNDSNLKENITFTGYRNDVKNIIAYSDVVYSLSREPESFGRTVIESIKLKTPFIGYDHGGVGEQLSMVFPEGLVELSNKEALYEKTKKILREQPEIKDTNLFSLEGMLSKTLKTYEEISS